MARKKVVIPFRAKPPLVGMMEVEEGQWELDLVDAELLLRMKKKSTARADAIL